MTGLDIAMRAEWHAYALVAKAMLFTLPMMIARLTESAVSSLAGGYVAALIDGRGRAPLIAGILLFLPFAYFHYTIFAKFPLWYHLTFLLSLPILSYVGGKLVRPSPVRS